MSAASEWFAQVLLILSWPGDLGVGEMVSQLAEDLRLLQSAKLPTDGPGLVKHFRRYVPSEEDRKQTEELAETLSDRSFAVRERATTDLIRHGTAALPTLRRHIQTGPLETTIRAQRIVDTIERGHSAPATAAALRMLALRRPEGACDALLGFAPACADELVEEELLRALRSVGVKKGKVDPALFAALRDPEIARRSAAALVVGRYGTAQERQAVQPLLKNASLTVRLRAAQGLIAAGDASAIPALLPILREGTSEQRADAEELLLRIAGKRAPTVPLGEGKEARSKCHDAWQNWYTTHKGQITLANVDLSEASSARARQVVGRLVQAMLKRDVPALRQTTEMPFHVLGQEVYQTRQEFEAMMMSESGLPEEIKLKVGKVVSLAEFLKDVNKGLREFSGRDEKTTVDFAKKHQRVARIVYVHVDLGQQAPDFQLTMACFVRSSGLRARVFAVGLLAQGPAK